MSISETSFRTWTGNGSAADDLSGSRAMTAATSSDESDANWVNATPGGAGRKVGGAEPDVVDLILSTCSQCWKIS